MKSHPFNSEFVKEKKWHHVRILRKAWTKDDYKFFNSLPGIYCLFYPTNSTANERLVDYFFSDVNAAIQFKLVFGGQ